MSEKTPDPYQPSHPLDELLMSPEDAMAHGRERFVGELASKGLVSTELVGSGRLDMFELDTASKSDRLQHILIGDHDGGGHHLGTIMGMEVPGRELASRIDPESGKQQKRFRRKQGVEANGAYKLKHVVIDGVEKARDSAMFPNEWSTDEVVHAVLDVHGTVPVEHDKERRSFVHMGEVHEVPIRVISSEKTGKIITASPVVNK